MLLLLKPARDKHYNTRDIATGLKNILKQTEKENAV
jgi:hypothetical protein